MEINVFYSDYQEFIYISNLYYATNSNRKVEIWFLTVGMSAVDISTLKNARLNAADGMICCYTGYSS